MKLLAIDNSTKTAKSDEVGKDLTAIMYMMPSDIVPGINVCPMAKIAKCEKGCLVTAGKGMMPNVVKGRTRKTEWFRDDRDSFMLQLVKDIEELKRKAAKRGVSPVVRLNGTSDIAYENIPVAGFANLMEMFPDVQFYDYTKLPGRKTPPNYHLTVSYSGADASYADKVLRSEHNVAVVFRDKVPAVWLGRQVIDGDKDDRRFADIKGRVIVGLKAKGRAKGDDSGFVVDIDDDVELIARG